IHSSGHLLLYTTTPTPQTSTLSLHDALPISCTSSHRRASRAPNRPRACWLACWLISRIWRNARGISSSRSEGAWLSSVSQRLRRSEEHTSELQSRENLVCRLLLEKKKKTLWW